MFTQLLLFLILLKYLEYLNEYLHELVPTICKPLICKCYIFKL